MYALEKFVVDQAMSGGAKANPLNVVLMIVMVVAFQILFIWFAKLLWNTYLVKSVTFVKPVKDLWHMLAIFVLIKLLF
jgi:hypothetical protein